ncbi:hypothetical protein AQUCO_00500080v1 [Aquilegia coerulea]|uniref:Uncharacterized protein n=1 Tax=Aquilegia coerulea TaxID=218851 RepID=A0A2G5EQ94_AQUCA|nr:hypothetical protein AQUCO_00500080v1 [Aquilegia coerulea]
MYSYTDFLLNPVFKHGLSAVSHIVLLLVLLVCWVRRKLNNLNNPENSFGRRLLQHYKPFVFSCWGVSLFNLLLCVSNYMYWHLEGWSDEDLMTQFDLVVRTLAWVGISSYLYFHFSNSSEFNFPFSLKIWWGFFFLMSCSFSVIDIVLYWKYHFLPIHFWVPDVLFVVVGVFFSFAESRGSKKDEETLLQQPLLSSTSDSINIGLREDIKGENSCPLSTATFFSILTFSWMSPLLALGNEKTINLEDVPQLSRDDSVKVIFPIFRNKFDSYESKKGEVSSLQLAKALLFSTRAEILWTALLTLLHTCASYVGPYLINSFVRFLNSPQKSKNNGYILMFEFIFSSIVQGLSERQASFGLTRVGIRVHAALVAGIYGKLQTLSSQSRQVHSSGEVINLMAVDAGSVIPLQIVLALFILYTNLKLASVAAFLATIILMLVNFPVGKYQNDLQVKLMKSKDQRMKTTSEILRNMKILKLQGWEMKFLSKIVALRENEEGWLRKFLYTSAISTSIFNAGPALISIATFGACILMGFPLESGNILSALATFRILKDAIFILPRTISMLTQTKVSLDRISSFLSLDDRQPDMIEQLPSSEKVVIEVKNGNFTWGSSFSSSPTLKNLNFQVFCGMRVGVCGTVGSGKSSLLSCILGEITKVSGNIRSNGTKAYVAQSPWIQSGKVQENILFGKEMDRDRYERVLEACSLKKDLTMLSFGDQTVIGERGINLSGGQKQRIQIARAIYQDTDIYLFDYPFSALDAHTGMHVYKECLLGFLFSKTVIYTTNQVEYLPSADLILVVKDGSIIQSGIYSEILASGTDFEELVGAHNKAMLGHTKSGTERDGLATETVRNVDHEHGITGADESQIQHNSTNAEKETVLETQAQIVQEEEREKGRAGIGVYWNYITTAYGGALVPFILIAQILYQSLQIASNYWISWATPVSKDAKSPVEASTLIFVYIALVFGSCICVFMRATIVVTAGYKTATVLFERMHLCIFRAPMSFFDATPSGSILTRASSDQNDVDWNIPVYMWGFAITIITVLGAIFVMAWAAWQVCAIFIPVIVACFWYQLSFRMFKIYTMVFQKYYIAAARELVRLAGVCNAPLKQHFTESISGLTTIRSFAQEKRFTNTNMKLVDSCSRPEFYSIGGMSWLGFHLDMLSCITFGLSLIFIISIPEGLLNPVIAGLAVTYGLNLNMLQAFLIWLLGILESKIISVERILQCTRIPNEPPLVIEAHRPNPSWPSHGEVAILNLQALDKCQLGDEVRKKEGKLDSPVTENGENWSMGQRQLVCLGRVVLKRGKILVLDEATSSVDTATDNLMQKTLKQHFSESTVITIAHRITSVLDSNMVLVLDNGQLVEYNSPSKLLKNKSSSFAKLVNEQVKASRM